MRCHWLPVLLFAAASLAESVGYWTLHNFQLFCDAAGITCVYNFSISEDEGATQGNQCMFTVDGQDGKPANQTDFKGYNCLVNPAYKINGGWSDQDFVTIVVTNVYQDTYAFFAYPADKIVEGESVEEQTRLAYKVGTFDISSDVVVPEKRSGTEWQVVDLQHDYDRDTGMAVFAFAIQDGQEPMSPCTIAKNVEAAEGSFYNEKCVDSNWVVSWDYSALTDSATMTVIEPNTMMKAWFQWENVSVPHVFGDSVRTMASSCDDEMRH